jgi:hypothetical protein
MSISFILAAGCEGEGWDGWKGGDWDGDGIIDEGDDGQRMEGSGNMRWQLGSWELGAVVWSQCSAGEQRDRGSPGCDASPRGSSLAFSLLSPRPSLAAPAAPSKSLTWTPAHSVLIAGPL